MIKKFFIIIMIVFSFGLNGINYSFSEDGQGYGYDDGTGGSSALDGLRERCEDAGNGSGKISCPQFTINAGAFSPGSKTILETARKGGGDTVKTANIILGTIIKNLIVVFGVLSLLMMTIGGGMMIFHSGQESILTKGKSMFMYGIISLVVGLSAGIIVQLVSYFLY